MPPHDDDPMLTRQSECIHCNRVEVCSFILWSTTLPWAKSDVKLSRAGDSCASSWPEETKQALHVGRNRYDTYEGLRIFGAAY
jgi:hypothetical protein